jgi:hypothetical protein
VRPPYHWVVPIAISWPALSLGVTFARFGRLPGDGDQMAAAIFGFLLVGALSGFVLISLLRWVASRSGRISSGIGYALAMPFGYVFGILAPLTLEALSEPRLPSSIGYYVLFPLVIGLYGSLPPICGAAVGSLVGRIGGRGP